MFSVAILIGIYSYLIFAIGLLGLLYRQVILLLTFVFFIFCIVLFKKQIKYFTTGFITRSILAKAVQGYSFNNLSFLLLSLLIIQSLINLIGTLGPELGFDALWYHLTLPKLYIQNHSVLHIPGSLLYYSNMPKLTEMLYTASLFFGNEILAKLVHFSFGLLSSIALYFLSKKFLDRNLSLIVVLIFYSNLVVGWQSITAYVDLSRTFFELMALWGFINFVDKDTPSMKLTRSILAKRVWLVESAVMLGLAVSIKLLALGSIGIFSYLIIYFGLSNHKKITKVLIDVLTFILFSLAVPLPWFIFSFVHTGNPIYPIFSSFFQDINHQVFNAALLNPINFIKTSWKVLTQASDPISPVYIIFLPVIILTFKKLNFHSKIISLYCLLGFIYWYFTSRVEGARLLVPYLPAVSLVSIISFNNLKRNNINVPVLRKIGLTVVLLIVFISIAYRSIANYKYLPVILGVESKGQFLTDHLNFSFGDFYDTDNYFKKNITSKDTVLLYGFHNLYYVNFPFIDSSWAKKGDRFNYIATQNSDLPKRFSNWNLIYYNPKTHVNLYSLGGIRWVY
ncbi:MAG: hypothetical protein A3B44_01305 [Candidatus Levybacteria bacterium RIFCSPLOWO2_01_FULL_38_21]|nr:MAG: hypothetical protein A3B44_01305 [Candidatus Levybacteria bacterium RIFCSPLOWO2_01_FULL_38_21]